MDLVKNIADAQIYDIAIHTPLEYATKFSKNIGSKVYYKREDLQSVHSFKIRGAYNKMSLLSADERARGVIAASAGNHAQGVALSAQKLGLSALIVMPVTTPAIKVDAVQASGAEVVLFGDSYSESAEHCKMLAKSTGRTFIHPYDDLQVIAGQGTIGKEIIEDLPNVTHIFVPVGGGGLIAGIASYVKYIAPHVKIISVEPEDAATLHSSLRKGKRLVLKHVGIFADGVAVKQIGKNTFAIAQELVDETIVVNNDELCAAIKTVFEDTRSILEPAGALAVAGIQLYAQQHHFLPTDKIVAINSGANINFEKLQYITERTLIGSGKEVLLSVELDEEPGSLELFCQTIKQHSISEFNYRQSSLKKANILVGLLVSNADRSEILDQLEKHGFKITDLSSDELAKEHVRHMVGGKTGPTNEQLVHFDFPERPGALAEFLKAMRQQWNISLFHYRGMGSDVGRVLMGFDVPKQDMTKFKQFLNKVGFAAELKSDSISYKTFLARAVVDK